MTAESAEKHCSVVLNVKLQLKLTSKRFIDFKSYYTMFSPWTLLPTRLVLLKMFANPSNKSVIYGPKLNL